MVSKARLVLTAVLVVVLVGCAATQTSSEGILPGSMDRYTQETYGWSIDYPSGWLLDSSEQDGIRTVGIRNKDNQAWVHVSNMETRYSLTDFVDMMTADDGKSPKQVIVSRQPTSLPDGTPAIDVVISTPRYQSRSLYVVWGGPPYDDGWAKVVSVIAETHTTSWDTFSEPFDRIVKSFTWPH